MRVNFGTVLCDLAGNPLKIDIRGDLKILTLGLAAIEVLMKDEHQKSAHWQLAKKIGAAQVLDLSDDNRSELMHLFEKHFPTMIVGPAFEVLLTEAPEQVA